MRAISTVLGWKNVGKKGIFLKLEKCKKIKNQKLADELDQAMSRFISWIMNEGFFFRVVCT